MRTVALEPDLAAHLTHLREEEKLARDVYRAMYRQWGRRPFLRISRSEQRHMNQVLGLLQARGLPDPVESDEEGVFTDPDFAALYDDLVARGQTSEQEAFRVGAEIEDLDLRDLHDLASGTSDRDVRDVCARLINASENHMRAMQRNLRRFGDRYESQWMSQRRMDTIVTKTHRNHCHRI